VGTQHSRADPLENFKKKGQHQQSQKGFSWNCITPNSYATALPKFICFVAVIIVLTQRKARRILH